MTGKTLPLRLASLSSRGLFALAAALVGGQSLAACSDAASSDSSEEQAAEAQASLTSRMGPEGGEIVGEEGSAFEGVTIVVPPGALEDETVISLRAVDQGEKPLPKAALPCGPMFALEPADLELALPIQVTLPFDPEIVKGELRFEDEVKVWVATDDGWGRELPFETTSGQVSIELGALTTVAAGINPPKAEDIVHFSFRPIEAFEPCIARYPDEPSRRPEVDAIVVRGEDNDAMWIRGRNMKPELAFDLFTIERSLLDADGVRDADFAGFGLAWYQTDLKANRWGNLYTVVRTVLLDEIFGLDADVGLVPTQTFHVGFWFNDPEDAVACGFNASKPTPFNGEQNAGPLAMTTVPDAESGLGPLCTKADLSTSPVTCER